MRRPAADWVGNSLALVLTIVVNVLANALPTAGKTTGQVSDKYFSLFTPAGFTFSVWGLIYLVVAPFSLYLGWISVATIANASAVQSALYWNDLGFDATAWTLIKLALAGAIACIVSLRRHDLVFPLVIAWAAFGISRGQAETPAVAGAATTVMLVAVLVAAYGLQHRFRAT